MYLVMFQNVLDVFGDSSPLATEYESTQAILVAEKGTRRYVSRTR